MTELGRGRAICAALLIPGSITMFRILITPAIFDTRETAHEAQALAMREAAMLSRDCGVTVECKVFRMGQHERDAFGRDVTPAFLIGRAVAASGVVEWRAVIPLTRRAAA